MNILSLFDGMSCAQIALNKLGVKNYQYFASEVDKFALAVAQANYPETVQLGSVENNNEWLLPVLDLIVGGSPCQGFSFAGKQLNFEDPRSKLFYRFVECLDRFKPKYFLLENVKMKAEYQNVISLYLGVEPIEINSALVSAQNRKRLYWTNIPNVAQPKDKGLLLKDIIESGGVDREKSYCLDANYFKGGSLKNYREKKRRQLVTSQSEKRLRVKEPATPIQVGEAELNGHDCLKRVYSVEGKSPTLTTMGGGNREPKILVDEVTWRKLTPLECERLQTVPEGYTDYVSNSQRYKMLGNGFTADVIAHILSSVF